MTVIVRDVIWLALMLAIRTHVTPSYTTVTLPIVVVACDVAGLFGFGSFRATNGANSDARNWSRVIWLVDERKCRNHAERCSAESDGSAFNERVVWLDIFGNYIREYS